MNLADEDKVNDSTTPQYPHPNTTMTNALKTYGWLAITALWPTGNLSAQTFAIETVNDSLNYLTLKTDSTTDRWTLAYPVYRLETGDVDGDGRTEALVGVIKSTRFYPQRGRRLFVFKNYKNRVRSMWMGSKLGGILQDFRFVNGVVRSLETCFLTALPIFFTNINRVFTSSLTPKTQKSVTLGLKIRVVCRCLRRKWLFLQ